MRRKVHDCRFDIRLRGEDKALVLAAADIVGLPASELIRRATLLYARGALHVSPLSDAEMALYRAGTEEQAERCG